MNLNSVLENIGNSSRICQLRTKTPVKLNKKNRVTGAPCPYVDGITKLAVRNVILNCEYKNAVNNQLVREEKVADFVPEQLWKGKGRRVSKMIFEHIETHQQYLAVLPKTDGEGFNITKSVYIDNSTGSEIDKNELTDYMPPKNNSTQGTDKPINWELIKLENILGLKSGDLIYERA
jgi:hypothetical protein